ncbi:hypothetical protein LUZ60_017709 [Juncus effusus]|nr:hypothetical protein LUZ60_017709 [Juncus effusus]
MNFNNPNMNNMNSMMMSGTTSSNPNNPNNRRAMINNGGGGGGGGGGGDLVLRPTCDGCGAASELYGSACKHRTLCLSCGRSMALSHQRCPVCSAPIRHLIREYNVRANASTDKSFSIGRFVSGLPPFSKKKSAENKWSLHKDLQGRQLTDALKEKLKNKPWILEDETGQFQYQGPMEGSQSSTATYYLLMLQGKEFLAYPAGSWYNFTKVAQYKQLTLEEAEEKMNKRRHNATGYERWMMKAAANGAAAFGVAISDNPANKKEGGGEGKGGEEKKGGVKKEEGEEEGNGGNNGGTGGEGEDDEGDGGGKGDFDFDDDDIEKGDDWEHEEIFTDDDEAVGNDREEREDLLAPEIPAPPEIKQDDEEEEGEENGGLSNSGKELKKLLGKAAGLESEGEDDDDDDEDDESDLSSLAQKKKDSSNVKDEPGAEKSPLKNEDSKSSNKSGKSTPGSAKSGKGKRKPGNEDSKVGNGTSGSGSGPSSKKPKTEPTPVKEETPTSTPAQPSKQSPAVNRSGSAAAGNRAANPVATSSSSSPSLTGPVTEEEIRNVIMSCSPITTQKLVAQFKPRLKNSDDKNAFAEKLKRISKIQKTASGAAYIVLREN